VTPPSLAAGAAARPSAPAAVAWAPPSWAAAGVGGAGGGAAGGGGAWGVGHLWLETAALGKDKRAGSTVRWVLRREKTNIHNEKGNAIDGLSDGLSVGDIFLMNSHRRDLYRVSVVVCVIGWRQPKPAHRAASKLETTLGSTLFTASDTLTQAS
jgi:hypothetical protein